MLDLRKEAIRTPAENMETIRVVNVLFFSALARNMRVEKGEDQLPVFTWRH